MNAGGKLRGLFGEAKQNHNLRRARYRGFSKMQIQLYMIALVQNLERSVTVLTTKLFSSIFN
ncbi:transposase [Kaarinaea lacus]